MRWEVIYMIYGKVHGTMRKEVWLARKLLMSARGMSVVVALLFLVLHAAYGGDSFTAAAARGQVHGGATKPSFAFGFGLRSPPTSPGVKLAEDQWFAGQKLDHFDPKETRTWKQRYFVNDTNWDGKDGPVFVLIGGEGPASPAWLAEQTEIMVNAQMNKALVFSLEHRFYGQSRPTDDISLANLKYLSSRQALADIQAFKAYITQTYNLTENNKWISFGGSYSGALSAWLRIKYPDVVIGALASSAPVQAIVNFYEYLEVVNRSLATSPQGNKCPQVVSEAMQVVDKMLRNESQWKQVDEIFNVDPPLMSLKDARQLVGNIADAVSEIVQYNLDNTAFEGRANNITISDICGMLTNASLSPEPLTRLSTLVALLNMGEPLDASYQNLVQAMNESTWDSPVAGGARQWYYQTCTEFGYYQTTDSIHQPFGSLADLHSYSGLCRDVFDTDLVQVHRAVDSTNEYYGGKDIPKNVTNIVFPNGSIDPWHALSILKNVSSSVTAIYINGTAHCANMYPYRKQDSTALLTARYEISYHVMDWLK